MAGPQRGASEDSTTTWASSPRAARIVRALVFLTPVVGAWLAVRFASPLFGHPPGWFGLGIWAVQALIVGGIAAIALDRVTRRALPLATLLGMTLTFPDHAPNRFSLAMRTGTVRQMKKRLDELAANGLSDDTQEAAEQAIEMVTLLGRHERLTRGHTERVRAYADVIAREMRLPENDRQMLSWGVLLHDIGKLSVPPEILNKNGRPTEEEWAILQTHPAEGARILAPLAGWLGDWALAASEHHERWDGNGYPNKLSGREISLAGRITAVADAYDVITSRRSYKAPMSVASARLELVRCSRTQFDPAVVRAMLGASIEEKRRLSRSLAWLPQVPGLAAISNAAILIPPAVIATAFATAVVAAASTDPTGSLLALVPTDPVTATTSTDPPTPDKGGPQPSTEPSSNTSTTSPSTASPSTTSRATPTTTTPTVTLPGETMPETTLPAVSWPVGSLPELITDVVSTLVIPTEDLTGGLLPDVTVAASDLIDGLTDSLAGPPLAPVSTTAVPPLELPDLGLPGLGFRTLATPGSSTTMTDPGSD